ncbi:MAG: hypothetical protein WA720_18390 [Pseudolabrys sp.]
MKVAALAALSVLTALPADAGQHQRQNNISPTCDNDGRCTTLSAAAFTSNSKRTSERKPHHAVDANGNSLMVTVKTPMGSKSRRIPPTPASFRSSSRF